ncbi:MAG: ABC transporter substrate-binding protein [Solirubrobacterales bacterium]|nr:ABC transporter substrate-binding protein [Solirubrobacterales bacterium]
MSKTKLRLAVLAFGLVAVLALAACGSDSDESGGSGSSGETSVASIPDQPESGQINMGIEPWIGYAPWYIAQDKGFFKKNGIDVKITNFNTDDQQNAAFIANHLEVSNIATHTSLLLAQEEVPAKIVLVEDKSLTADAVIAPDPIKSIKDLKGKSVAYEQGTTSDILIHYALAQNGMSTDDINVVPMNASDAGNAVIAGKVDAAVTYEPYISAAKAQDPDMNVLFTAGENPGLISDVMVAQDSMIQDKPGQVLALVKSWNDAVDFYNQNPEEAQAIITKGVGATPGSLDASFAGIQLYDGAQNAKLLGGDFVNQTMVDVRDAAIDAGYLKDEVDPAKFVDPTFVEKAQK